MKISMINQDNMLLALKEQMNAQMMEAAEPVIREAVAKAEQEMRKKLAHMFISIIDKSFSIEKHRDQLTIVIEQRRQV